MKRIIGLLCLIFIVIALSGCKKAKYYTDEEHTNNVRKIIEEKYLKDGETYELRPLYNNDDKLQYFVVDFSNNDFFYIEIMDEEKYYLHSLYIKSMETGPWVRVVDVINGQMIYETDESGQSIRNYKSHFKTANIPSDTRGYLIKTIISSALVPSIKVGDKYLDLITMQEYDGVTTYKKHYSGIYFSSIPYFRL